MKKKEQIKEDVEETVKEENVKSKNIKEIKTALKTKNAFIGTENTLRQLKLGFVSKIFISLNAPDNIKKDIEYYSNLMNVKVFMLDVPNEELGIICQKPFSISVIGIKK
jgi:large subunit ribosomal protein L30e